MEGLKLSDANIVIHLHPSKQNIIRKAINRQLSYLLFGFSEQFDGVLLAYEVDILSKNAKILSGVFPYFGVKLKATLLLFSPKKGMLVEGKVSKIAHNSINAIVLGFSNATITDEDIRREFKYRTKHGKEAFTSRSHKRHVIKVGTMIRFLVKSFDEEALHIYGSLVPSHTGNICWLDRKLEDDSVPDSSKRQRESEQTKETQHDTRTVDVGTIPSNSEHHRAKKSKKRRIEEALKTAAET